MRLVLLLIAAVVLGSAAGFGATWLEFGSDTAHLELAHSQPVTTTREAHPIVEVEGGNVYDFGSMEFNSTGSHIFVVRNVGQAPLRLTKGETTCKCTLGDLSRDEIPPGESGEVRLEWTPHTAAREFTQRATIYTNDPNQHEFHLTITGEVEVAVRVMPGTLSFGRLTVSEPHSATARLYGFRDGPIFQILDHEVTRQSTADRFHIETRALREEEVAEYPGATCGYEITVTIEPGLQLGSFEQSVVFTTDVEGVDPIGLKLEGEVVGDISLMGGEALEPDLKLLKLDLVRRGAGRSMTIYVIVKGPYLDQVDLQIGEIDPAGVLQATLGQPQLLNGGKVRSYPLTISIPSDAASISRMGGATPLGRITIETNHPETPEVVLYVRFAVEG